MMLVAGHFRFPVERIAQASEAMARVIAASLAEPGCIAYAYAEDVNEPGLFRVTEAWESREALERHFATDHMRQWQQERDALGFHDRDVWVYEVTGGTAL